MTRPPEAGAVGVQRRDDDWITITCGDKGGGGTIICCEYNARRILAMLSLVLELPLTKAAAKQIEL